MRLFRLVVAAGLTILAGATAAFAAPATATSNVNLRSGPGTNYAVVGTLRTGQNVEVIECQDSWCFIEDGNRSGWASSAYLQRFNSGGPSRPQPGQPVPSDPSLNFGITIGPDGKPSINFGINQPQVQPPRPGPGPGPRPPRPPRPQPVPPPVAEACFYAEPNYRGASFCLEEGESMARLPRNWNDRIRSVEVLGGATVDICGDANFYGVCQTLESSRSRLANQLDRRISSLEVY
ncbi:SH3 domain-containing protein [Devosia limi]|uniref:Uncharacterized conserved protein YraI n=1 Tax=Devosia limi DSM 17137 TaxID=1121477 RepID=A0A1M5DH31_9HYPH|nr:SH3 domain-containing protein [Devosia limi]SHF66174.1 Uncharacterized conserved protein YraI [Devosia limi DSM 17137]